ncbi:cytochrome b [Acidomonas methanolica]|uniref:cytochrome b n=1 Tax=Acidomonas methanolica TaxID=437 RepID=UPI00211A00F0|nr:cytochrome b/b6 domain-containing protein [Acidomonas methanolica]MCQ9156172.1 cytochrome b [Acidomonas methanolica]
MTVARYSSVARWLHWLMAAIIIPVWCIGFTGGELIPDTERDVRKWVIGLHKELATTIIILVVLRLAWRAGHVPPQLPGFIPAFQRKAARVTQAVMYVLLLVTPVSGWAMSNAYDNSAPMLWLVTLPRLVAANRALGGSLMTVHQICAWTLGLLLAGHIAIGLHHALRRDAVWRSIV